MIEKPANFILSEIESIEDIGKQPTYDFVIPLTHSYFANGILIHNSGTVEQDADMVFLLHRKLDAVGDEGVLWVKRAKGRQIGTAKALRLVWLPDKYHYADYYEG